MSEVATGEHQQAALAVREMMAAYRDHEDLISIGAYRRGSNRLVDAAIEMQDDIHAFLRQPVEQSSTLDATRDGLMKLQQKYLARLRNDTEPT
jgi:flagellum-specific ATP synthase